MTVLGADSNVDAEWETGVFTDMFTGSWGAIDGNLVSMTVSSVTEDYVLYAVPILLNGEECILTVAWLPEDDAYEILTATPDTGDGPPSKTEYLLEPGDEVTPIFYRGNANADDGEFEAAESFTVTEDTAFETIELPDGGYIMGFSMMDYAGEEYLSDMVMVIVEDGIPVISEFE